MLELKNIFCINLDKRPDRLEQSLEEFKKIGISNEEVTRFVATPTSPGIKGCTHSHYRLIKHAKEQNLEYVVIFEDDFTLVNPNTFKEDLNKSLTELPEDWDMLYLGVNLIKNFNKKISDSIVRVLNGKTTHAYIVHSKLFDHLLGKFESFDWDDKTYWNYGNPNRMNIDVFYTREIQPNFKVYGTFPCLCDQREGFSDILNVNKDYKINTSYDNL